MKGPVVNVKEHCLLDNIKLKPKQFKLESLQTYFPMSKVAFVRALVPAQWDASDFFGVRGRSWMSPETVML